MYGVYVNLKFSGLYRMDEIRQYAFGQWAKCRLRIIDAETLEEVFWGEASLFNTPDANDM